MKREGGESCWCSGHLAHKDTHGKRAKRHACMGCMGLGRRLSSPGGGRKEGEGEDPITTHHAGGGYQGGEADVQMQHPTPYSGRDMILAIGLKPTEAGGQGKHGMGCLLEERRT